MLNWIKKIFKKKCPECGSKNTHVETYVSYAYNKPPTHTGYGCKDCNNYWVHNAPKENS